AGCEPGRCVVTAHPASRAAVRAAGLGRQINARTRGRSYEGSGPADSAFIILTVVRIAATGDRRRDAGFRQPIAVAHREILGSTIAVMDQAGGAGAAAVVNSLLQRIEHEVGRE